LNSPDIFKMKVILILTALFLLNLVESQSAADPAVDADDEPAIDAEEDPATGPETEDPAVDPAADLEAGEPSVDPIVADPDASAAEAAAASGAIAGGNTCLIGNQTLAVCQRGLNVFSNGTRITGAIGCQLATIPTCIVRCSINNCRLGILVETVSDLIALACETRCPPVAAPSSNCPSDGSFTTPGLTASGGLSQPADSASTGGLGTSDTGGVDISGISDTGAPLPPPPAPLADPQEAADDAITFDPAFTGQNQDPNAPAFTASGDTSSAFSQFGVSISLSVIMLASLLVFY
jgi:hypothetical protein